MQAPDAGRAGLLPRADVLLALAFCAASLVQVAVAPIASPAVSVLVAVGSTLPLAARRRFPASAALAGSAIWLVPTTGYLLLGYVVLALLYYSVGTGVRSARRAVTVCAVGVVLGVTTVLASPQHPAVAVGDALVVIGPAAVGRLVARQREQAARLEELTARLVEERSTAERVAVAEERARIARELHDVIGHEVTVIALQADAAAAALAKAPERAAAPVETIRSAAAETLAEMRRVVGLLRTPGDDEEDLRPQPGLADLPALVERARAAGTAVGLVFRPPPVPPPQSLQVTVYRVVQEALTNARRHAPGSSVRVRVEPAGGALCVEVLSAGGHPAGERGGGHGLVGMRERVRVHGGRLDARPTADGFAVVARLPLGPEASP